MSIIVDENEPLFDVDDYAFEPRDVQIRNGQWVDEEFEILDFLGRGKFGEVKRCRERKTGREFAAKFILAPRPQDKEDVRQEMEVMKKLQHKRLLQLYDAFCLKNEMCLILEIIQGGELFDRVILDDFILTERACVVFMRQICEGVEYMHNKNVIHLDLKPENILCLTRTGNRVKIIDFGLAREYDPKKELRVLFGTPEFMAPEVVQYEPIAFSTDMWSVGVICYVLLSGLSPFMGDCDAETLTNVIKASYDFNYPEFDEVSDSAKDLISRLLVIDKRKRLTATECLDHPWLRRNDEEKRQQLQLSKRRLKRFVYRRKWQKVVNAIIALKRMGVHLENLRNRRLSRSEGESILSHETIFGWDAKRSTAGEASRSRGHETSPDTDAADSGVGGSLKDTLGELALDSSGTAAPVSSDGGASDDIRAGEVAHKPAAAAAGSAKRIAKAAGAAGTTDKKSKKEDVAVEKTPKSNRSSLNSDSSRGDKHRKTSSSLDREKTPELTVTLNKDKAKSSSGKRTPTAQSPSREKSPETSKRKKHSSTETPVLKKSKTPDRLRKYSEQSQTDKQAASKDSGLSRKEKTSEIASLRYKTFDNKDKTPEPTMSARGIGRLQGFGKENQNKTAEKNSKLDVSKVPLDKSISTPAEVSLKVSPKVVPKQNKHDLIHKKPNLPSSAKGRGLGKTKAKDDSELTKKDSKISSHVAEIERKASFRRTKKFNKSMRDSINLKDKIAPTIQTRSEDKRKKDDKKIEDNPTERPKSWVFENNPFRKQDMVQNSPDKVNKFDKNKEPNNPEKRKKSLGTKADTKTERNGDDHDGKTKDENSSDSTRDRKKESSDQSQDDKTGKKKNKLSEFPSVSNPNISLYDKHNGVHSNESTLERRPVKRHRILIEPPVEKLEKMSIISESKRSESSEAKSKASVMKEKSNSGTIDKKPMNDEKKLNAHSSVNKQKSEPFTKGASGPNLDKQTSEPVKDSKQKQKELPNIDIAPSNSKLDKKKSSVHQNEARSPPFGATFIKTNPFKLVSFNAAGSENKPSNTVQSPKSDASESTGESSKPPTPTKQKGFSLFRKGSDKRKNTKSPTPDTKGKGLFRRGSDKNKNKSAASHGNHKGSFGSGSPGESSSSDKKANSKKPPSPKVDLRASNGADVESVSASPRDESDMKILTLIKKGKGTTPAGSNLGAPSGAAAPPSISPSLRKKNVEPEQQYKSRFAAMKAMWHMNN